MKRFIPAIIIALFFSITVFAQPDEDWNSKKYKIDDFSEIYIEGGYRIHLIQGDENKLVVKASDSDVFEYLQVKQWGDELRIDIEPENLEFDRIALYITFKEMEKLHIEGGVKLYTKGYLDLKDFEMYVGGGAKIEMDMKADDVKIVGEGGVMFELNGIAKSLEIKLSGAGHVDAADFKVEDADFRIEGVGSGSVHATETLTAKIEGVGKISYKGNPELTKNVDGIGSITRN